MIDSRADYICLSGWFASYLVDGDGYSIVISWSGRKEFCPILRGVFIKLLLDPSL